MTGLTRQRQRLSKLSVVSRVRSKMAQAVELLALFGRELI